MTGASRGIGRALALELGRRGFEVVLCARGAEALTDAAGVITDAGGRASARVLDVSDTEAVAALVREEDARGAGLDLVVANAGLGGLTWAGDLSPERCEPMLDVNVRGAVATLTAALPAMVARRRGHLAAVTSMAAMRALPHNALYSATKAFLRTFLDGLRLDLGPAGVSVTEIRPGFVRTEMIESLDSPTPFVVEPEAAATTIADALARRAPIVAFPAPTAAMMRAIALLPRPVYEPAARWVRPRPDARHER